MYCIMQKGRINMKIINIAAFLTFCKIEADISYNIQIYFLFKHGYIKI